MMKCIHIKNKLSAYQDDTCNVAEQKQIETHLANCQDCAKVLANMQKTWDLLNTLPSATPHPFAATRIQAQLTDKQVFRIHTWPARLGLAVSVSAALIFGIFAGSQWPSASNNQRNKTVNQWADELQLETLADLPQNSLSALYFDTQKSLNQGELK